MVGQPVKYTPDKLGEKFIQYIAHCKEKKTFANTVGFCVYAEMTRETYYEYKRNHPEYSDTIRKIENLLEDVSIQKGMDKPNAFVQFYMKNKFKYSDKTEVDIKDDRESAIKARKEELLNKISDAISSE